METKALIKLIAVLPIYKYTNQCIYTRSTPNRTIAVLLICPPFTQEDELVSHLWGSILVSVRNS